MITIGAPGYINTLPLFLALKKKQVLLDARYTFDVPTRINKALLSRNIDVGLVSSACFLENEDQLCSVTPFGIGAKEQVLSVKLFTRLPPHKLTGKKIALTEESETSVLLLKVLALHFWHITPTYVPLEDNTMRADAFLLIGDKALLFQHPEYLEIDLAKEWFFHTQTPFTFALFASPTKTHEKKLEKIFSQTLSWSQHNENLIIDEAHKKTGLEKERLTNYFNHLCFVRTKEHQKGLQLFSTLAKLYITQKKAIQNEVSKR